MKTAEDYYTEHNGGKSPIESLKDGELISPVYAVRLMEDFAKEIQSSEQIIHLKIGICDTTLESILAEVAYIVNVPISELKMKKRGDLAKYRMFYYKRARLFTGASFAKIGNIVGKDHSTVLYGIKKVDGDDIMIKREYEELFEGKAKPVKTTIENKAILIGQSPIKIVPEPIKRESKYKDIPSANNRPFHGYVEHQL